jgi:anti-sigma factor RsiW
VPTVGERKLTCREVVELVTAYLEDVLEPSDRSLVAAHLTACDRCSTYLDQMRQTVEFLRDRSGDELTAEAKQRLLIEFRSWHPNGIG